MVESFKWREKNIQRASIRMRGYSYPLDFAGSWVSNPATASPYVWNKVRCGSRPFDGVWLRRSGLCASMSRDPYLLWMN